MKFVQSSEDEFIDSNGPDSSSAADSAARMASAIATIVEEQGGCLPQDLLALGFTAAEIARWWPVARALADVQ